LITLQTFLGYWALDESLAALIGCSLDKLKEGCPIGCSDAVWGTLLALAVLNKHFSTKRDEWELIAMKSENWLKNQKLPSTLASLKLIATEFIKIN
jgi:hypothetical protein